MQAFNSGNCDVITLFIFDSIPFELNVRKNDYTEKLFG